METQEQKATKEIIASIKPKIRLELFRHDDRMEKAVPGQQNVGENQKIPLSFTGRINAQAEGRRKNPQPETAIAYGSNRDRSLETSLRQMLSERPDLEEKSFEEIKESVTTGKIRKYITTPLLDYNFDSNEKYRETIDEHYFKKKDAIPFLYYDSDKLAVELGDEKSTTYSRFASNIATLLDRYVSIFPQWQQLTQEKPEKYSQYGNVLQRFMGSHGGVLESFLLKVIDKQEGREAAEEFINNLPDKNGFGYSEGYSAVIDEHEGNARITLFYRDKSWTINREVLKEIKEMK